MVNQISPLEKTDSDRMIKERDTKQDQQDQKPLVRNNDSDVAPEKNQNDVLRHHE
ncbi:hypothetical protein [Herminiimonas fonticola]|uniref:Uncharacterized protein n=1 Tax=Herminiimonas fonticola TaxID=303380 RepID=A0A4R6G5V9_9BURK|nr:hypothetical protein [Herminiimonas fonticola]RBA23821.1 hypothetical protein Hfont_1633 [Herminiimonas fonticola]TDN89823.1 hypothetical protein EV677_1885 [Herminiimonas fonticola]